MRSHSDSEPGGRTGRRLVVDSHVRAALVTAACLLVEAVVAKNALDAQLGFMTQLAPMWVFIAYLVSGLRDRSSEIAFTVTVVVVTAAILVLYAM